MAVPILLPGDVVPPSHLPPATHNVKLSSGLTVTPTPSPTTTRTSQQPHHPSITATHAGPLLSTSSSKNKTHTLTLPRASTATYTPTTNDLVIGQVKTSSSEAFHIHLAPFTPTALLPHLAFENASKKTRPQLKPGDLVYARVISAPRPGNGEVEISCVNPATGKAEPGGLGPLGMSGTVVRVSTGLAARLMLREPGVKGGCVVLDELGRRVEAAMGAGFEVAVGKNGVVWIDVSAKLLGGRSGRRQADEDEGAKERLRVALLVAVGRCLAEVDRGFLGLEAQRKLVGRVLREMGVAG